MARFSVRNKQVTVSLLLFGALLVLWLFLSTDREITNPELLSPEPTTAGEATIRDERQPLAGRITDLPDYVGEAADSPRQQSWNCRVEDLPQFSVFADDEYRARLAGYASRLAASQNAEHILAAAMLSDVIAERTADGALIAALELDPTHPQVLWWAADLCARPRKPEGCNDPTIRNRVSTANRDNGAYWAILASQQLRNGDELRAIESLQRASTAATMDYMIVPHVLLLERGLSAVSDLSYEQRFSMALAVAPLPGWHKELYTACRERIREDHAWAQACLDFGRRLSADGTTIINKMIGYGIQRNVLRESGNVRQLQAVNDAMAALRRDVNGLGGDWELLMLADPRFVAQYAEHFAVHGEVAAAQFARDEIARLRAAPDYNPCSPVDVGERSADSQR